MANSVGAISIDLSANIANFVSDLGRAQHVADQQAAAIARTFSNIAGAVGVGLSVAGFTSEIKGAIDSMLALNAAAKTVGTPTEQFTAMAGAARRADVDVQSFTAAILAADKALAKAQSPGPQASAFAALGIDPKAITSNNDLILKAADALSKYRDGIGKSAVEMEIFGRSGAQLNQFLDQGSKAIQDQEQHMKDLGVAFGTDGQKALQDYDNAQKDLSDTITGLRNKIAIALLPALKSAAQYLGGFLQSMDSDSVSGFTTVINTLAKAALVMGAAFETAGKAIGATVAIAQTLTSNNGNIIDNGRMFTPDQFSTYTDARLAGKSTAGMGAPVDPVKQMKSSLDAVKAIFGDFGKDTASEWQKLSQQIADFGDAAKHAAATATGAASDGSKDNRPALNFNPNATADAEKLATAYQALTKASYDYSQSLAANDAQQKAIKNMVDGVVNLTKLRDAYIQAGGSVTQAQAAFDQGFAGLKGKLDYDLGQPKRDLDAYTGSLDDQLAARKQLLASQAASIGMGTQEAQNYQQIAQVMAEGADAVAKLQRQHELNPEAFNDEQYAAELKALKQHNADLLQATKDGQAAISVAQSDWHNGVNKALADFMEQQQNIAAQGEQIANTFLDGFGDAFAQFASGAESAKSAFGSLIDSMYQQSLKFLANKAIQSLFDSFGLTSNPTTGSTAGGFSSILGNLGNAFGFGNSTGLSAIPTSDPLPMDFSIGAGFATGGMAFAGSVHPVNENGPELFTYNNRDYLAAGSGNVKVTPITQARSYGGNTTIVNVQPTSTRRTADQIAQAVDRKQRTASARNG